MTSFKVCLAAGAAMALTMAISSSASAAVIIKPVAFGPFDLNNSIGTILGIKLAQGNTYDFTFDLAGDFDTIIQLQAADFGGVALPIDFTLFSGTPGSGLALATTPYMTGAALERVLLAGSYYIEVGTIAEDMELVSGSLTVSAAGVPEPTTWALMIAGFGLAGASLRRRRSVALTA